MLYLLEGYRHIFGPLRLFEYVTFRSGGAFLTSLLLVLILGKYIIPVLQKICVASWRYENILASIEGADLKKKTPTMGGILIVIAIIVSTVLWGRFNRMLSIFLVVLCILALLGIADDFLKIKYKTSVRDGVPGKVKLIVQFLIALLAAFFLYNTPNAITMQLFLPFFKNPLIAQPDTDAAMVYLSVPWSAEPLLSLSIQYTIVFVAVMLIFNALVVTAASNAVNLTDGKDGLAAGCVVFSALAYAAMAYLCGHLVFSKYLNIPYVPGAGEVCVLASAIVGACMGFLWYNCKPASVFMGDTGSLPLGGVLGLIAVLLGQQLSLIVIGFVFVMEAGSVMLQVFSYKVFGKRIFLMSPIHHHFEKKGWTETQIVTRFYILAGICALIGLATLKLR